MQLLPDVTGFTEFYYYFLISDIYKWTYFGLRFPLFPRIGNGACPYPKTLIYEQLFIDWLPDPFQVFQEPSTLLV